MYLVIFITASCRKEAEKIAQVLLKYRLAACINIIKNINSFFWWQGKVDKAEESLLIIKTKKALFSQLISKVKAIHSYKVPEIIAIPIVKGERNYLDWLDESVRQSF
ncbi:MAG: divalent-cation tolerance protein CutA [Candidatus Omnitrophica bacterium]|nr:divalent-cation tolerance protein CutA [Candidatus Omnitrophota bacterium]